jgi:hypothetical protein
MENALLPCDVLYHILNYLECKDLCSFRLVSTELKQIAQLDSLWKDRCDQADLTTLKDAGSSWMYTFVNARKYTFLISDNDHIIRKVELGRQKDIQTSQILYKSVTML